VSDARDEHEPVGIVDRVDDSVVTDSNSVVVSAGELHDHHTSRIGGQTVDDSSNSIAKRAL
jgi:hypothetical protein